MYFVYIKNVSLVILNFFDLKIVFEEICFCDGLIGGLFSVVIKYCF